MSDEQHLGSDRLWRRGKQLVVETAAEMDGWDMRRHRKTCIHFQGVAYQILRQEAAAFAHAMVTASECERNRAT